MSRLRSVKPPVKSLLRNHLIELASPHKPASGRCLPRSARSLRAGPGRGCNPSRTRAPRDARRPRSHREPSWLRLLRFRLAPLRGGSAAAYGRPGHTLRANGAVCLLRLVPTTGRARTAVRPPGAAAAGPGDLARDRTSDQRLAGHGHPPRAGRDGVRPSLGAATLPVPGSDPREVRLDPSPPGRRVLRESPAGGLPAGPRRLRHQLPPDGRRRLPVRGRLRGSPRFGAHRVRARLERHPDLGLAPPRGRPSAIHEADPTPWRAPRAGRRGRDARVGPSRRFVGTMPPAPPEIS